MLSKLIAIAVMILSVIAALRLLKLGLKVFSFFIWLLVVSLLIYLAMPILDPFLQNFASSFDETQKCFGLVLESGDCFGIIK